MANVVKYVPAGSSYDPYTDSDVGTVVSYNSSTGRVEFKDIDFNALGALLGLTKPFTFKDCVLSPNVNPNAIFKPSTTAPYTLADFAGYQHTQIYSYPPIIVNRINIPPTDRLILKSGKYYAPISIIWKIIESNLPSEVYNVTLAIGRSPHPNIVEDVGSSQLGVLVSGGNRNHTSEVEVFQNISCTITFLFKVTYRDSNYTTIEENVGDPSSITISYLPYI